MDSDICDRDTRQSDMETYLSDVKSVPESERDQKALSADLNVSLNGLDLYMSLGNLRSRQHRTRKIIDVTVTFQKTENFIISLVQHDVYNYEI